MTFTYLGESYELFDAEYNDTAHNERAVEVPVAMQWAVDRVMFDGVEVGNVLGHYGFPHHRVVDLYEVADGVENVDMFTLEGPFDWVLSISTIEHVSDAVGALEHLRSLLAPGGALLVTVGGGQHEGLDAYLADGAGASRCSTLVRSGGRWVESRNLEFLPYGYSTRHAESVFVGEWGGT